MTNPVDDIDTASTNEEWRDIAGYEGLYKISNMGRVKSLDRCIARSDMKTQHRKSRILAPVNRRGYLHVNLCKDSTVKAFKIHRLVAGAFLPNPKNLDQINHKDENPLNNALDNLEWCDCKYNSNYGSRNKKVSLHTRNSGNRTEPVIGTNIISGEKIWFPSMSDAGRNGFSTWCVWACCSNREKTHKGYTWERVKVR